MSYSYAVTETAAFTATHAKHISAKVATDLKRMQRLYGTPSDSTIAGYEAELIELLKAGYLGTVTYGFWREGNWTEPTLRYTAGELSSSSTPDDDPGRVRPGASITGASFYSYLTYSLAWHRLSDVEKAVFKTHLPFQRGGAPEPGITGYLSSDKTYSAGGRSLNRSSVRNYG